MTQARQEQENRRQLKNSIFITMLIVPLLPFLLAAVVNFYYFFRALEHKTIHNLKEAAESHGQMIDTFLAERTGDLELVTDMHDFAGIRSPGVLAEVLDNLKEKSMAFVDLGVFDAQGVHLDYCGPYELTGKQYKDEKWFGHVLANGLYISDIFMGYRKVPHFVVAVRKQGADGNIWVARATIDTRFFSKMVSGVQLGRTGEAYILNKKGIVQSRRRFENLPLFSPDPDFAQFQLPESGISTFPGSHARGTKFLYAAMWIKNHDWLLVVRQEKKDAYASLYRAVQISSVIMLAGLCLIFVTARYTTQRILARIDRLGMEKKSLGHQLIRATQLAEIGEMATGFAHEINNPLQIIKGEHALMESVMEDIPQEVQSAHRQAFDECRESLDQILLQVNRCSDITHSILKFGRENEVILKPLEPCQVIPDIVHLVEKKAQVNGIEFTQTIAPDAPQFMGDPSQFQQVLLNLFNNAMDAIADRHGASGGKLDIQAFALDTDKVAIKVSDNGTGIKEEYLQKIFSPFFTTKPVGKGTGLGLSVCYGIIESFGGVMKIETKENVGTTFFMELPAVTNDQGGKNCGKNEAYAGG